MAFTNISYPKTSGDTISSADYNEILEAIQEGTKDINTRILSLTPLDVESESSTNESLAFADSTSFGMTRFPETLVNVGDDSWQLMMPITISANPGFQRRFNNYPLERLSNNAGHTFGNVMVLENFGEVGLQIAETPWNVSSTVLGSNKQMVVANVRLSRSSGGGSGTQFVVLGDSSAPSPTSLGYDQGGATSRRIAITISSLGTVTLRYFNGTTSSTLHNFTLAWPATQTSGTFAFIYDMLPDTLEVFVSAGSNYETVNVTVSENFRIQGVALHDGNAPTLNHEAIVHIINF